MALFPGFMVLGVTFVMSLLQVLTLSNGESLNRTGRDDIVKVTTILLAPYYMEKSGGGYEGYVVDLMQKISDKTNLTFRIQLVADSKYGTEYATGAWNGMIGEVVDGHASVAAAPLIITEQRKTVVNFTIPLMSISLSFVTLKCRGHVNIRNAKDLADQTEMKCGVLRSGSTITFFRTTLDPILLKINQFINSDPNNLINCFGEGLDKIRSSDRKYGVVMESITAEYYIGRNPCDLMSVTIANDVHQYGLAVKAGSHLLTILDNALEHLMQGGNESELEQLKKKWWNSECNVGTSLSSNVGSG